MTKTVIGRSSYGKNGRLEDLIEAVTGNRPHLLQLRHEKMRIKQKFPDALELKTPEDLGLGIGEK